MLTPSDTYAADACLDIYPTCTCHSKQAYTQAACQHQQQILGTLVLQYLDINSKFKVHHNDVQYGCQQLYQDKDQQESYQHRQCRLNK